jgi:hypothetical protein
MLAARRRGLVNVFVQPLGLSLPGGAGSRDDAPIAGRAGPAGAGNVSRIIRLIPRCRRLPRGLVGAVRSKG